MPPSNFVNQFVNDLKNPGLLDINNLQWVFDSNKLLAQYGPDYKKIFRMKMIDKINRMMFDEPILEKWVPLDPTNRAMRDFLIMNFDSIFLLLP